MKSRIRKTHYGNNNKKKLREEYTIIKEMNSKGE